MRTKSFNFTHVVYDADDPLALPMVLLSLAPQIIIVVTLTILVTHRSLHAALLMAFLVLNDVLSRVLKDVIQQPRPANGPHANSPGDWGMPSSHCQFMCFLCVYGALLLVSQRHPRRIAGSLALAALAAGVAVSRVHLLYHTVEQVLVGGAIGGLIGVPAALAAVAVHTRLGPRLQPLFRVLDWVMGGSLPAKSD